MNTITPDHNDPGCGFFLQAKLGLGGKPVLDIKTQCMGLIYGLSIADHYIKAGTYRNVLIACSEVLSKRIDSSYEGRNLGILLGDGAGAVVVGPSEEEGAGILSTILHADGTGARVLYTEAPGSNLGKVDLIDKEDIEAGRIHFRMKGREMFENGVKCMSDAALESFELNGVNFDDVDLLIPHQANLRMLEAVIERIGAPLEKVFLNVEEYGNMASACLPVAIDQALKQGRIKKGELLLLIAFGSGFVWGSALIRM
jgi:3-oxoacyl-[acyl-carrier-protein] synthase-3